MHMHSGGWERRSAKRYRTSLPWDSQRSRPAVVEVRAHGIRRAGCTHRYAVDELITCWKRVTDAHFFHLLGATNLAARPSSTEMVIQVGHAQAARVPAG